MVTPTHLPTPSATPTSTATATAANTPTPTPVDLIFADSGRLSGVSMPNGVSTAYTYDRAGRLTGLAHSHGSDALAAYQYTYDADGNRVQAVESIRQPGGELTGDTIAYTYDPLDRLTAADYSAGAYYHYTYDAAGNRLSQTTLAGTMTYTYDIANRLAAVGGVAYIWDANGNLLSDGTNK